MDFTKFKVNHLVTFTSTSQQQQQSYLEAIKRLQEVEEVVGVWRQKVFIQLDNKELKILDVKTNEVIEQFPIIAVQKPENIDYNSVYNNLLVFTVYLSKELAEMHIFDCRSNKSSKIVDQINGWRQTSLESLPRMVPTYPTYAVHNKKKELKTYALIDKNKKGEEFFIPIQQNSTKVKQTVSVFNQIAIERQKNEKIGKMNLIQESDSANNLEIKPKKLQPFRYF